jgi:hypothetical protein
MLLIATPVWAQDVLSEAETALGRWDGEEA